MKKNKQLQTMPMKVVSSLQTLSQTITIPKNLFQMIIRSSKDCRSVYQDLKNQAARLPSFRAIFFSELQDLCNKLSIEFSIQLKDRDSQIEALRRNLEETKKRNNEFVKMIQAELQKKDQITSELESRNVDYQHKNLELEEILEAKVREFQQYKSIVEAMVRQNDTERRETREYIQLLEGEIKAQKEQESSRPTNSSSRLEVDHDLGIITENCDLVFHDLENYAALTEEENYTTADRQRGIIEESKARRQLQIINQVTQTCLTTEMEEEGQQGDSSYIQKYRSLEDKTTIDQKDYYMSHFSQKSEENLDVNKVETLPIPYDPTDDLEIVRKFSNPNVYSADFSKPKPATPLALCDRTSLNQNYQSLTQTSSCMKQDPSDCTMTGKYQSLHSSSVNSTGEKNSKKRSNYLNTFRKDLNNLETHTIQEISSNKKQVAATNFTSVCLQQQENSPLGRHTKFASPISTLPSQPVTPSRRLSNTLHFTAEFPSSCVQILLPTTPPVQIGGNNLISYPDRNTQFIQNYLNGYTYQGSIDKSTGERSGYGVLRRGKKQVYAGQWRQGVYNGWGKLCFEELRISNQNNPVSICPFVEYTGVFENGYFHGRGTILYTNGDKYIGEVVKDCIHGQGTYTKADGTVLSGLWENNALKHYY